MSPCHYTPTRRVVGILEYPCPSVHPSLNLVYVISHLSFCWILFIFGILVGHNLSMCILCKFHGWLIFGRVITLFMFVWPCVHLVYATSHLSVVTFYSYLVSWLVMIWACAYYTDFTDGLDSNTLYPPLCLSTTLNPTII